MVFVKKKAFFRHNGKRFPFVQINRQTVQRPPVHVASKLSSAVETSEITSAGSSAAFFRLVKNDQFQRAIYTYNSAALFPKKDRS